MKKFGYRHNYKKAILFLCGILLHGTLLAQEQLILIAEKDTVAFRGRNEFTMQAGDIVISNAGVGFYQAEGDSGEHFLHISFIKLDDKYWAPAKDFRPLNTVDIFEEDIFIDYPMDRKEPNFEYIWLYLYSPPPAAITDAMWVPHYYADILRGQDRNMLIQMSPDLGMRDDEGNPWYTDPKVNLRHGRAMFYDSAIRLGEGTHLAVRNIQRTGLGYRVDSVVSIQDSRDYYWGEYIAQRSAFWKTYNPGDAVTLLLYLDGDYLDIYTEGTDIHVGTFIRVGREFQTQYQSLIRYNTSDLTNVVWSARADGTRHFEPPVIVAEPPPEVAETPVTTPVEVADIEAPPAAAEENAQNAPVTSALPLWVWLAIGGGALAALGGVFVVARRKRVGVAD